MNSFSVRSHDSRLQVSRPAGKFLVAIFVLAFVVRLANVLTTEPVFNDQYWEISQSLAESGEYAIRGEKPQGRLDVTRAFYVRDQPTACRAPMTPVYLAICRIIFGDRVFPVRLMAVIMGGLSCVLVSATLTNAGAQPSTAVAGGFVWALWPPSVVYSNYAFFSEPFTQLFSILIAYMLLRPSKSPKMTGLALGLVFGLTVLNRAEQLVYVLLVSVYCCLTKIRPWQTFLAAALAFALMVLPWLARNSRELGKATFSTLDGFALLLGNNPWARGSYAGDFLGKPRIIDGPSMQWVTDKHPEIWDVGEVERSRLFWRTATDYVKANLKDDPGRFLWLESRKFMVFWHGRDGARKQSLPDFLIVQAALLAFFGALWIPTSKRTYLFVIPMLSYLVVALVFYASARNRFPNESSMFMFLLMQWDKLQFRIRNFRVWTIFGSKSGLAS